MDSHAWNEKVIRFAPPFGAFLQSYEWGEFQTAVGRTVERFFIEEKGEYMLAQGIKMPLPMKQHYWYVPKGPLGNMPPEKMLSHMKTHFSDGIFLRVEPTVFMQLEKALDVQPAITRIVDLRKTQEALYNEMKSKTRYNARLSERQGVECRIVGLEEFDSFMRLMKQTAKRDKFSIHPEEYFQNMLKLLTGGEVRALLAIAFVEGRPLAANICVDFAGVRTYLHGATSNLHRNIRAQYGLHAFLIRDAQERNLKIFDFWGVASEGYTNCHEWAGISRYKEGYGGLVVEMPGTFDCILKTAWYKAYQGGRKLRRL